MLARFSSLGFVIPFSLLLSPACTGDIGGGGDDCPDCDAGTDPTAPDADPTDYPDADCPSVMVRAEPITPTVQLLIDQSGSMNEDFGGVTRWNAVRQALADPTTGVVAQLDQRVVFGATLYTSTGGNAGGVCPMLQEVTAATDNYAAIAGLLAANDPVQDTPTAEAIAATTAAFPAPAAPDAPRILVVATDGNPDNCVDPDAHDLGSQQMSESAVVDAYGAGIETFVLSVGDQVAQSHLQRMANAGTGQPLDTGTAPYYVANDPVELVDAFDEIIRGARVCTFDLDGSVDASSIPDGDVRLNGDPLTYGTDWTMVDGSTLELLGAACDRFLDEDDVALTAEWPCGAVIL